MKEKKVLMIHEFKKEMLDLNLEDYILTFDDGLYTQYLFLEELKQIDTKKIFFISTDIICPENEQQIGDFITCREAHQNYFTKNKTAYYMKWSQIKEINEDQNCIIGGHSHFHKNLKDVNAIKELFDHLTHDTEIMLKNFQENSIKIEDFCFPYNYEAPLYRAILEKSGIENFYGKERIAIEDLL